jgi:pyruvate formate lyase activating enzyme
MKQGLIFDIKTYAIHDGPGIRTTIFLKGCPLSCLWCDNPESQNFSREFIFWPDKCLHCDACISACKKNAIIKKSKNLKEINANKCDFCGNCVQVCYAEALQIVGQQISVDGLLEEIEKDTDFYLESGGGITFSGGEPFSQPEFLYEMLVACKERNFHIAIDTCGYVSWNILKKMSPYVDLFLFDIKLMDEEKHRKYTGVSNKLILAMLEKLVKNHHVIIRIPLIPQINDDENNIRRMGEYLSKLNKIEEISHLPYHKLGISKYEIVNKRYAVRNIIPPTQDRINDVLRVLERFGFKLNVGG